MMMKALASDSACSNDQPHEGLQNAGAMTSKGLSIRQASLKDAAPLAAFGARTFRASFGADNRPEDMEQYVSTRFSTRQIEAELADPASTFLLAFEGQRLVGYAKLRDGREPACVEGEKPIELERIYVEQELKGRGYGSVLMESCLQLARGAGYGTIWLGVWEKNLHAIGFYEKWGFAAVGSQKFVLGGDVQDDLVMARSLKPAA